MPAASITVRHNARRTERRKVRSSTSALPNASRSTGATPSRIDRHSEHPLRCVLELIADRPVESLIDVVLEEFLSFFVVHWLVSV